MKLSPIVLVSFLPLLALGNPMAEADPAALEPRADEWCTLFAGSNNVNCRAGSNTSSSVRRVIHAGERFGVRCKNPRGESVDGNRVWDYIPGWNCWVSARFTNSGCESKSYSCFLFLFFDFVAFFLAL